MCFHCGIIRKRYKGFELRHTSLVLCKHTGTRLDEEIHTGHSRRLNGPHEGRGSAQGRGIDVSSSIHQKFNEFPLPGVRRMVEGGPEELVTHVHISPVTDSDVRV